MINVTSRNVEGTGGSYPPSSLKPSCKRYFQLSNGSVLTSDDLMAYQIEVITKLTRVTAKHFLHGLTESCLNDRVSLKLKPSNIIPDLEYTLERLDDAELEPTDPSIASLLSMISEGEPPIEGDDESGEENGSEGEDSNPDAGEGTDSSDESESGEPSVDPPEEETPVEESKTYPTMYRWSLHWAWEARNNSYSADIFHEDVFKLYFGLEPNLERVTAWIAPQIAGMIRDMFDAELEEITEEQYDTISRKNASYKFKCKCLNASTHNCDCAATVDTDTGLTWICDSCNKRYTGNGQLFYDMRDSANPRTLCLRCTYMAIREFLNANDLDNLIDVNPFVVCLCSSDADILAAVLQYLADPIVGKYFKQGTALNSTCCCSS